MGITHEATHLRSTGAKCRNIARIVKERRLRHSQPQRPECGTVWLLADIMKCGSVGFAGLGGTGTHAAFEISILGHDLAFHVPDRVPQQPSGTIGPR